MIEKKKEIDGGGVVSLESNARAVNGTPLDSENYGFRTYKRRKPAKSNGFETKLVENGMVSLRSDSRSADEIAHEPADILLLSSSSVQESPVRMVSNGHMNGLKNCLPNVWRNIVLEQIYQSLKASEGGLQECVREAIVLLSNSNPETAANKFGENKDKCPSESGIGLNGISNVPEGNSYVISNGSMNETSQKATDDLCRLAFLSVIESEKFAQLCGLLCENFEGMKFDSMLNILLLDSKLKEGVYSHSPILFHSDIQQVWNKLEYVGNEIVTLAKSLSDISRAYFPQVGGLQDGIFKYDRNELRTQYSRMRTEPEHADACCTYSISTCRQCREKADGRDCLVCDFCEEMYHVSCIEPAVKEIPQKSWYCAKCTLKTIKSPHENCVVCERLHTQTHTINEDDVIPTNKETPLLNLESSSDLMEDGPQFPKSEKNLPCCHVCGNEIVHGEQLRLCGHSFCPHKYYHTSCLTDKQLTSYGPCWYCPSCLCRVCLSDRDDESIVLCDSCDHAYHLYCMEPPRTSIPRGKWFCRKCDADVQRIRRAKRAYESIQSKLKEQMGKEKQKYRDFKYVTTDMGEGAFDKSGGVDMLLSAARTLNY